MSQENVEIARKANAAFNSGDPGAFLEFLADDIELVDRASAPDQQQAVRGKEAVREAVHSCPEQAISIEE